MCILAWKWPFTRDTVIKALQQEMGEPARVGAFHATFFPLGYIAEDLHFGSTTPNSGDPIVTVRKMIITANYSDLLFARKKIEQASIVGLHLIAPSVPSAARSKNASSNPTPPRFSVIGQIKIEDSLIEFPSPESETDSFKIAVKSAIFDDVNRRSPSPFRVELVTNEPSGAIHSTGRLGPWNWNDAGQTPLTGAFTFHQADLSTVGNIKGHLNSQGKFAGPLNHVDCSGTIDVPRFGTSDGNHALSLSTTFHATVNGLNGDTVLNNAESRLNRTVITAQGEVKGGDKQQAGKTAHLHLSVNGGHIEDLLLLFTQSQQPSMRGIINLQADIDLPPGDPGFLKKLELRGNFGVSNSRFTKASTQAPINRLSKSAEGMSKEEEKQNTKVVLSDIKGQVSARNGVASLSHVSFTVPGAQANLAGTYNLLDKTVHLEGTLRTTGEVSDTTSGWKAGFLTLLSPFLKKHSVTIVPFKITGTAQNSTVALDLARKKRF